LNTLHTPHHCGPANVLGLVLQHRTSHSFSLALRPGWYENAPLMRITQSISLSNIKTLPDYREGPP